MSNPPGWKCPTCTGPIRQTVGMVCQTCGTDYAPQMTEHDPECAEYGNGGWLPGVGDCQCALIARVRTDERERVARLLTDSYVLRIIGGTP